MITAQISLLASEHGKPDEVAKSLDGLLDEAIRIVPSSIRSCMRVAVKAAAGSLLRLFPGSESAFKMGKYDYGW